MSHKESKDLDGSLVECRNEPRPEHTSSIIPRHSRRLASQFRICLGHDGAKVRVRTFCLPSACLFGRTFGMGRLSNAVNFGPERAAEAVLCTISRSRLLAEHARFITTLLASLKHPQLCQSIIAVPRHAPCVIVVGAFQRPDRDRVRFGRASRAVSAYYYYYL